MQDDEVDTMRKLTIAALMVASMAGSSVALAGNPTLEAHKDSAKSQYSQSKDSAKSSAKSAAQSHKATASSKASTKTSHASQAAKSAKSSASNKASDTQSRYQKKSYADVLKNERH